MDVSEKPTLQDREDMFVFLHAFSKILPCLRCRRHWTTYIKTTLPSSSNHRLDSKSTLTKFLVDAHNDVNRRIRKPIVSYAEARNLFDPATVAEKTTYRFHCTITVVIVVFVLCLYIFKMSPISAQVQNRYRIFLHQVGSVR